MCQVLFLYIFTVTDSVNPLNILLSWACYDICFKKEEIEAQRNAQIPHLIRGRARTHTWAVCFPGLHC